MSQAKSDPQTETMPIQKKVNLALLLIFALVMAAIASFSVWSERAMVLKVIEQQTMDMATSYFDAINILMITENMDKRELARKKIMERPGMVEARIIRGEEFNRMSGSAGSDDSRPADELDRRALAGESVTELQKTATGDRTIVVVVPMLALSNYHGTNCLTCHQAQENSVLGAVRVAYSLKGLDGQVSTNQLKLALVQLAVFAVGFFIMMQLISRLVVQTIIGVSGELEEAANQVAATAAEVYSSSQSLADGASGQAAAVEQTSSSLEEVNAMIKQDFENARQANGLMKDANQVIRDADSSMMRLTTSMAEIASASSETQKIVKTIDEIAFQTNLLALNAAVEAARAGEAGAGFAVVADEVRNLAMRAAAAARNTSELIEGTVLRVKTGSALVEETSAAFNSAAQATSRIGTIIEEMAGSSGEQAKAVDQVTTAIHQIDNVTQSNAAAAEETAAASAELASQSEVMKESVGHLLKLVGGASHGPSKPGKPRVSAAASKIGTKSSGPKVGKGRGSLKTMLPAPAKKGETRQPGKPNEIIPMDNDDFEDF
ncbi:MAG: methyl-accepting chemotaxis protein [Desulfurivibrionaceae bacterium]